jgi:hypothetical protein
MMILKIVRTTTISRMTCRVVAMIDMGGEGTAEP